MTSQINYSAISTTFPVAGKDNNSQGFRDNFTAISVALASAKTEISDLQTKVLLASSLNLTDSSSFSTAPVVNNLLGSKISNGIYSQFDGQFYNGGTILTAANIDPTNGPIQQFTASGNITLTLGTNGSATKWPASGRWSMIRIMLVGDQVTTRTVTFAATNGGLIKPATGWTNGSSLPATVTLNTTGKYQIIEAWTVDAGANVFVKNIGEY